MSRELKLKDKLELQKHVECAEEADPKASS